MAQLKNLIVNGVARIAGRLVASEIIGNLTGTADSSKNADALDGLHASNSIGANTVVTRDHNGYTYLNYINSNTPSTENPTIGSVIVTNSAQDGFYRKATLSYLKTSLTSLGTTSTNGDNTGWSTFGIKDFYGCLPEGLTSSGNYTWGETISIPGVSCRLDLYVNHVSSENGNGIWYRSGWGGDKRQWAKLLDTTNYTNYSSFSGQVTGSSFKATSDRNLKENIEKVDIDDLSSIGAYSYILKTDASKERKIGLIAQDVQKIIPEAVSEANGHLVLDYNAVLSVLISSYNNKIKEQDNKIKELQTKVDTLLGHITDSVL